MFKRINQIILAAIFTLSSPLCFTHEGHDDPDVILPQLGDLGTVEFAVSCGTEEQAAINTGVALLHHMMYAQAELHFGEWIKRSPKCAMLFWGYSMTLFHPLWPDKISEEASARGAKAIAKAKKLSSTKREVAYINAAAVYYNKWQNTPEPKRIANWANSHKIIADSFPDDIDAVAFYALSLLVTASKTDSTFSQNIKAGKLLARLLISSPNHPGAIHYTIHAYDNPLLAVKAIDAARAYDKIAPDVPHALHMPSHIFVRLGMWDDAAKWNVRSAKAALKYPSNGQTSMHYAHAVDYLVYSYMQLNQKEMAQKAFDDIALHPPLQPTFPAAYALSSIPARIALESHQWETASQIPVRNPSYINWEKFPHIEAITYFSRGIGAARSNNIKAAKENLAVLYQLQQKTFQASPSYWAILVNAQTQAVAAWISYAQGDTQGAITQLTKAADLEDSVDKNPVTPGAVLPIRELLGDMLVMSGDPIKAKVAYQTCLKTNPNRFNSLAGINTAQK